MTSLEDRIEQEMQLEREADGIIYDPVIEPMHYIFPPAPLDYIFPPAPLHYDQPPSPPLCSECASAMKGKEVDYCAKCRAEKRKAAFDAKHEARINQARTCVGCFQRLPADAFLLQKPKNGRRSYRASKCHECRSEYARFKNYGITKAEFTELLTMQDGKCAICGTANGGGKGDGWHVDHAHGTGKVRGILCSACNTGIGMLGDSPDLLFIAAAYVQHGSFLGGLVARRQRTGEAIPILSFLDDAA